MLPIVTDGTWFEVGPFVLTLLLIGLTAATGGAFVAIRIVGARLSDRIGNTHAGIRNVTEDIASTRAHNAELRCKIDQFEGRYTRAITDLQDRQSATVTAFDRLAAVVESQGEEISQINGAAEMLGRDLDRVESFGLVEGDDVL